MKISKNGPPFWSSLANRRTVQEEALSESSQSTVYHFNSRSNIKIRIKIIYLSIWLFHFCRESRDVVELLHQASGEALDKIYRCNVCRRLLVTYCLLSSWSVQQASAPNTQSSKWNQLEPLIGRNDRSSRSAAVFSLSNRPCSIDGASLDSAAHWADRTATPEFSYSNTWSMPSIQAKYFLVHSLVVNDVIIFKSTFFFVSAFNQVASLSLNNFSCISHTLRGVLFNRCSSLCLKSREAVKTGGSQRNSDRDSESECCISLKSNDFVTSVSSLELWRMEGDKNESFYQN